MERRTHLHWSTALMLAALFGVAVGSGIFGFVFGSFVTVQGAKAGEEEMKDRLAAWWQAKVVRLQTEAEAPSSMTFAYSLRGITRAKEGTYTLSFSPVAILDGEAAIRVAMGSTRCLRAEVASDECAPSLRDDYYLEKLSEERVSFAAPATLTLKEQGTEDRSFDAFFGTLPADPLSSQSRTGPDGRYFVITLTDGQVTHLEEIDPSSL